MKKKRALGRHGDLDIFEVDSLPENKQPLKGNVLQPGEHTGHAHTLVAERSKVFQLNTGERAFITGKPGKIQHQEHVERPIPAGNFLVKQELYVDPIGETVKKVQD